jgi:hypothetical protein
MSHTRKTVGKNADEQLWKGRDRWRGIATRQQSENRMSKKEGD